jgi:DNA polymerase III delta prime subunit
LVFWYEPLPNFGFMNFEFSRTLGQDDAKQRLSRAFAAGRFPHALLVHGEPGLGQHALLLDIAQILACESTELKPCKTCFPCRAFDASALETLLYLIPITKRDKTKPGETVGDASDDEDGPESGQLEELGDSIASWHTNPYAYGVSEKAMVRMSQVRELLGRLRYSEGGRSRLVLVPWLESLNAETGNALLKTLEEPPENVYFLIASDHRSGLMQTLLSRCLHLSLSPLSATDFKRVAEGLARRSGLAPSPRLLPLAEGSPGAYLELLQNDGEALLDDAQRFLVAASSDWRVFADHVAEIPGGADGLERAARLIHFVMRLMRAHQVLRARAGRDVEAPGGEKDGYRWTAAALTREGWDEGLLAPLGAFEDIVDLHAFANFLEESHRAVREYSKPSIALTGLFLEYEAKAASFKPARAAGVAA